MPQSLGAIGAMTNSTVNRGKGNATRVRDNQRRSRARQKDYIRELEAKVQNYERLGVQASSQIQAAARSVLEENQRLRALLMSRDEGSVMTDERVALEKQAGPQMPGVKVLQTMLDKAGCCKTEKCCTSTAMQAKVSDNSPSSSCATIKKDPTPDTPQRYSTPPAPVETKELDQTSSPIQPPSDAHDPVVGKEPNISSTSCALAVSMITGMRPSVTADEIHEALGCGPNKKDCKVENSKLFSALDQYAE